MNDLLNAGYLGSLAIMGGTFDPIHYGHLIAAETVRQEYNVDKVLFMPSGRPPHKNLDMENDRHHRFLMCIGATLSNPYFEVSRIELDRDGYTYTVDTVKEIRKLCGQKVPVYFIVGGDTVFEIPNWRSPEELFQLCDFVVLTRDGYDKEKVTAQAKALQEKYHGKIRILDMPAIGVSSSQIRERIKNNKSIKYMTPENVETYILKNELYKASPLSQFDYKALIDYLSKNLSAKRFQHTIEVADGAVRLARLYDEDEDKAYLAGLLHDIAKEIEPGQAIDLCGEYGIDLDEIMRRQPDLIHGYLGAALSQTLFGVTDENILNAIRYHTTGRKRMSKLEKIILVADVIDIGRDGVAEIERLRRNAEKNLDKAVIGGLKIKIEYTKKKGKILHPLSVQALEYLQ